MQTCRGDGMHGKGLREGIEDRAEEMTGEALEMHERRATMAALEVPPPPPLQAHGGGFVLLAEVQVVLEEAMAPTTFTREERGNYLDALQTTKPRACSRWRPTWTM